MPSLGRAKGWLNTPSAHRVHQGSNPLKIDRNYAASLPVPDPLFGSYQPEVTTGLHSQNPVRLASGRWRACSGATRVGCGPRATRPPSR